MDTAKQRAVQQKGGACSSTTGGGANGLLASGRRDANRSGSQSSRVECERLPAALHRRGADVVSCLGSLALAELLERSADRERLTLIAPDCCAGCPEGGAAEPPGETARAQATRLLAEMGLGGLAPVLIRQPLNGTPRDDRAARLRGRRAFLRRMAGQPTTLPAPTDALSDRAATLAALKRLAAAHTAALPSSFFPAVTAAMSCAGHGVCVASCTTGALRWFESDGLRGVAFDAERCTACGDCVERCPEQALTLLAMGNGAVPKGAVRLSGRALRTCERCEDEFATDGDDAFCPSCRKDVGLFNDLAAAARGGAAGNEEFKTEVTT